MLFLVVGDIHVKSDNFIDVEILLEEIGKICSQKKPDFIVLLGDILHYHEKIFTQCLNRALDFIKKCSDICFTYILVGNHDYINNTQFLSVNHWMNAIKTWDNIKVIDKVISESFDDCKFILVPYVYNGRFTEALNTINEWNDVNIIFAHQEFKGCKMGAILSENGDEWDEKLPLVVSGHIHDTQKIGDNIYYPGAPLQHAFGDTSKRILLSIEILNNNIKIDEIELNVPKKYTINTEIDKLLTIKQPKNGDKVRIKLENTPEEFKLFKDSDEYKKLVEKGYKFQIPKNKNKIERDRSDGNFITILDNLVKDDIEVYCLYQEFFFDKLILNI